MDKLKEEMGERGTEPNPIWVKEDKRKLVIYDSLGRVFSTWTPTKDQLDRIQQILMEEQK